MRFVGICQYDGSNYSGFQSQKNASSIQDRLELAISSIGGLEERINYAGRTDAGVHATGQIFDFSSKDRRETSQWLKGLNSQLPNDISVSSIQKVPNEFHSRFNAINRSYTYVIYTGKTQPIFLRDYIYWEKHEIDLEIMRAEATHLIGTHNFNSFRGSKCTAKNSVRTLESINIEQKENFIVVSLCANAYLYNMVRIIVGTLLDISKGSGKNMKTILNAQDRKIAGKTAQAQGLFFTGADYKEINLGLKDSATDPLSFLFS
ncbi:tRNA pseudouridine(38-40) synthase TruA [Gammaproteobacteria bacterium]|nr:tRNA pseudouridine(38-40) synthase TruA [Gammaproteobacteria bacterium]